MVDFGVIHEVRESLGCLPLTSDRSVIRGERGSLECSLEKGGNSAKSCLPCLQAYTERQYSHTSRRGIGLTCSDTLIELGLLLGKVGVSVGLYYRSAMSTPSKIIQLTPASRVPVGRV
jgi:hypothetical protein